ncbi:hypothetical protein D7170_19275, partial [Vibrio cholerae]|nr:hypothetical protein [Vibrio cholerae]
NLNTTTVTTAAHRDWKRRALTVPLEAFVIQNFFLKYRVFNTVCYAHVGNCITSQIALVGRR